MKELNLDLIRSVLKDDGILDQFHILYVGFEAKLISRQEIMKYAEYCVLDRGVSEREETFLVQLLWLDETDFSAGLKKMLMNEGFIWYSVIGANESDTLKKLYLLSAKKVDLVSADTIFEGLENIFLAMGSPVFLRELFQKLSDTYFYGSEELKKEIMLKEIQYFKFD